MYIVGSMVEVSTEATLLYVGVGKYMLRFYLYYDDEFQKKQDSFGHAGPQKSNNRNQ